MKNLRDFFDAIDSNGGHICLFLLLIWTGWVGYKWCDPQLGKEFILMMATGLGVVLRNANKEQPK